MIPSSDRDAQVYDVFVSHTSSDKQYVRDLVAALREQELSLWFDEEEVEPSASFVRQIGEGLRARSAIAVISQTYLDRAWPRKELDVLIQRHVTDGMPLTIVAHGIGNETIDSYIALLADHPALPSSKSSHSIAARVADALRNPKRLPRPVAVKPRQAPDQRIRFGHLPATGGELLGRDSELATLDRYWNSRTNVATIVARGGEGKTALVWHWVQSRIENGALADARWIFVWSFSEQGDPAAGALDFINAALTFFVKEPPAGSAEQLAPRLVDELRNQRGLLILDGFETVQAPPGTGEITGSVRDPAIAYLVKEMVIANPGLCLVTTRVPIPETTGFDAVTANLDLSSLTTENGVALLRGLGVRGSEGDLVDLVERVDGHALSITLSGSYIVEAHGGEMPTGLRVNLLNADAEHGGHAARVLRSYERWLEPTGSRSQRESELVERANLLQILRTISAFDRPISSDRLFALLSQVHIPGLTDRLRNVPDEAILRGLYKLRDIKLVTLRASETDENFAGEGSASRRSVLVDTHPLIREYFYRMCQRNQARALRTLHRAIVARVSSEIDAMTIDNHWFNMAEFDLVHDWLASVVYMNKALGLKQRHRRYEELVFHAERAAMASAAVKFKKLRDSSEWNGWHHYSVKSEMGRETMRKERLTLRLIASVVLAFAVGLAVWFLMN